VCISVLADDRDAARAYHRQEFVTWSDKTGLSVEIVQRLWRTVQGNDAEDYFGEGIEVVDASSLRDRKHILFVVARGNGHCLSLYVFGNSGRDHKPLWKLSGLPNAGGICREQMLRYPTAYARPTGDIVVQVPTGPAWVKRKEPLGDYPVSTALMVHTYGWTDGSYKLLSQDKIVTYQSNSFSSQKCTFENPCE
jgi:hypothetical protein